jgi:hypothetical protein
MRWPFVNQLTSPQIHRLIWLYPITSEDWAGFLITIKASDARLPKSRVMRRTRWYAAVTRDEGNTADDVLMVDQGSHSKKHGQHCSIAWARKKDFISASDKGALRSP